MIDTTGVVALERATIEGVDFRRASFDHFAPAACVFVRCDFRGLVFDQRLARLLSGRRQSTFRECRFDEADLHKAGPGQTRFERCSFAGAKLDRWTSLCGEFVECTFAGPIANAKFHGRPHGAAASALSPHRTLNEFRANDFSGAELRDTLFVHGISFDAQRWPAEGHIRLDRIHQRLQRARFDAMKSKDLDARSAMLEVLQRLSTVYGEQADLVRVRYDPTLRASREHQGRVWELLSQPL